MRLSSLDFLRGVAAICVAIPHYLIAEGVPRHFPEALSVVAVEVFFILSGFVLAPQLLFCLEDQMASRIKIFLSRRWMRTIPPFVLALVLITTFSSDFGADFLKYALFVRNFVTNGSENDYFPVVWSLAIEEWFYVLFPLFLFIGKRLGLNIASTCILLFSIMFFVRLGGAMVGNDEIITMRRIVVYRLDAICFGFVLYLFIHPNLNWLQRHRPAVFVATAVSALALAFILAAIPNAENQIASFGYFYAAPVFAATALTMMIGTENWFRVRPAAQKIAFWLGALSYDIYLFHIPAMILAREMPGGEMVRAAVFVAATGMISYFVRVNFEVPILKSRPNYARAPIGDTVPDGATVPISEDRR